MLVKADSEKTLFFSVLISLSSHCTALSYFKSVMKEKILKVVIMCLPCIKTQLVFIISNLYYTRALTHTFQDRLGIACCIYITLKSLSRYTKSNEYFPDSLVWACMKTT